LDISGNAKLTGLDVSDNRLESLDVSKNAALEVLSAKSNKFTTFNVSNNTALTTLFLSNNQLTALDISNNTALKFLFLDYNQLTTLNITNNTDLNILSVGNNRLSLSQLHPFMSNVPTLILGVQNDVIVPGMSQPSFRPGDTLDLTSEMTFGGTGTDFKIFREGVEAGLSDYDFSAGLLTFKEGGTYKVSMTNAQIHNHYPGDTALAVVNTAEMTVLPKGAQLNWVGEWAANVGLWTKSVVTGGSHNWLNGDSGPLYRFIDGDQVTFGQANVKTVEVDPAGVNPQSVTVSADG
ncbi:MAG: hypothetical protein LBF38_10905, partial [Deltaproteobacteria bacterium]|jgi:hypothetical protein|nr:hypothetical protein [Deltaproteobacteria bacterium]